MGFLGREELQIVRCPIRTKGRFPSTSAKPATFKTFATHPTGGRLKESLTISLQQKPSNSEGLMVNCSGVPLIHSHLSRPEFRSRLAPLTQPRSQICMRLTVWSNWPMQTKISNSFSPTPLTSLRWITFSDSSWANRHDGPSQGGAMHLLADSSILDGQNSWASITNWKSWKLKRITKPSIAGEVQAFSEAQDRQAWLRSFWLEISSCSGLNLKHGDESLFRTLPPYSPLIVNRCLKL